MWGASDLKHLIPLMPRVTSDLIAPNRLTSPCFLGELPGFSPQLLLSPEYPLGEEELCPDSEICPRCRRGHAYWELQLQSLPLSRLMAALSLPLAGSGYITYLPDADLPAAAGGSLR